MDARGEEPRTETPPPVPDPMLGRTLLEFRIERKLAEGGMGAVYLARHVRLPSTLKVIKVLLPAYAANAGVRRRFHREAEAASKLKHESILGIDNFGAFEDGQLFLMIPYLEGQPLDAYLRTRGGRLSPHRALHLIVQLCDALDHAHAHGIVHRDLKPGNVYVVATNANPYALKLLDFGIAKVLGDRARGPKTRSGEAIGTPAYMAVEQYEHADEVTHLADVYSLAIMIWEMVTGRLPWRHPDPSHLYFQQRTTLPERPPADVMPPAWVEILLAALSVDPAARPRSARELAVLLASALPAVGRVPSGAEILAGLAPHFVRRAAPDDETVRNVSDVERIGPLLWPPRETTPAAPRTPEALEASGVSGASGASPDERSASQPTTLSAATGVASRADARRPLRWRLALAVIGTAVLTAVATRGIAARVSPADAPGRVPPSRPEVTAPRDAEPGAAVPPAEARSVTAPGVASSAGGAGSSTAVGGAGSATVHAASPAVRVPSRSPVPPVPPVPSVPPVLSVRRDSGTRTSGVPARAIDPDDVSGPEE